MSICMQVLTCITQGEIMQKEITSMDRILDAALETFAEKGFRGATTKEIAKRAKVNEVTLFRLFKTKSALFAATLSERSPIVPITKSVSFDTSSRIEDVLLHNVKMVLGILRSNKHLFMVLLGDAWRMPKVRGMIASLTIRKGIELLTEFMRTQMEAGRLRKSDPEVAARALMGMVQAYFILTDLVEARKPDSAEEDRMLRGFVSIFLDGMRAEAGGKAR